MEHGICVRAASVPHPAIPVLAERGGTQLRTPKATLLIDTREQNPLDFSRFEGWFEGVEKRALTIGDHSIAGMEEICVVERKDLPDVVHSFTTDRAVFVEIKKMSACSHKLLVITAAMSEVKSQYSFSRFNPNRVMQALIATLAGWGVPFLCTETHELGEEIVASYLYQVHLTIGSKRTATESIWPTRTCEMSRRLQGIFLVGRNFCVGQDVVRNGPDEGIACTAGGDSVSGR